MRSHLLLCYLQYLCYYVLLKLHAIPVKDHPVIDKLIEIRVLMSQLKPIETALQPQIQRLLQSSDSVPLQVRPELLIDESDSSDAGDSDLASELWEEKSDTQVYKPPKVLAMEYVDEAAERRKEKEIQSKSRREKLLFKSEAAEALREEFDDVIYVDIFVVILIFIRNLDAARNLRKRRSTTWKKCTDSTVIGKGEISYGI
jgi:hypothetical protein